MAKDYLAIPATSCLVEHAFSMSARTDDPRRRTMKRAKFGALQQLRDGYRDGRLTAETETCMALGPDFNWDEKAADNNDNDWEDIEVIE
jgi:hAT family C-terminal dimerisation region